MANRSPTDAPRRFHCIGGARIQVLRSCDPIALASGALNAAAGSWALQLRERQGERSVPPACFKA
eukprot:5227697-Alexandrium_andersonii.AAC.1